MRNPLAIAIAALLAVLAHASVAAGQAAPPQPAQGGANTLYGRLAGTGPGGPAPKRDFSGSWAGPLDAKLGDVPPMTPLGKERFSANKPERQFHLSGSNDPFRTCDPFGFPRSVMNEVRGIAFATMPNRVVVLNQYQKVWREIWTDGRELPKNVGGTEKGAPDPRYYGYSVGHWEGDYTFVVDTTGLDDRTWINSAGYPHSTNAHVQERWTRMNHNDLQLVVTLDDPAIYTKPFELTTDNFRWIPNQQLEEQLCVPSEMLDYIRIVGDPAGNGLPAN
jgi:hypothetical protein